MQTANSKHGQDQDLKSAIGAALGRIPSGLFILTAQYEDRRSGMLTSLVQQVCFEPPMVCVAVAKGRAIMPLISESRKFGLCQLASNDRLMLRKFSGSVAPGDDPFLGFDLIDSHLPGVPIIASALAYLECELTCHMDVEGDHDLFVGAVRSGGQPNPGEPHIHVRKDGFHY